MSKRYFIIPVMILVIVSGLVWYNGDNGKTGEIFSPVRSRPIVSPILPQSNQGTMKVRAFPLYSIAAMEGKQTIFILVQDRIYNPIPNVEISLIVQIPGKGEHGFVVQERTNKDGFTKYTFPYSSNEVGNVVITVSAKLGNLTSHTSTSFMIWW